MQQCRVCLSVLARRTLPQIATQMHAACGLKPLYGEGDQINETWFLQKLKQRFTFAI
ncbi:hypothetical protein [Candidatus Pantoea persica]|uniref:hypothetical protein n=1 Tax=Candidatus Pantoea persica TaxID=2518128 RepID=UPI00215D7824|nr:hypothetical protein [Candidatus Pantoea persica]